MGRARKPGHARSKGLETAVLRASLKLVHLSDAPEQEVAGGFYICGFSVCRGSGEVGGPPCELVNEKVQDES